MHIDGIEGILKVHFLEIITIIEGFYLKPQKNELKNVLLPLS